MTKMTDPLPTLVADIGGTNARFSLCRDGELIFPLTLSVDDYPNAVAALNAVMEEFDQPEIAGARLAVAGPVRGDQAKMTNGNWVFRETDLSEFLGGVPVQLFNDVQAAALSLPHLVAADTISLGTDNATGIDLPRALLSVGTGLGISCFVPPHSALATEAGHATLAATNQTEGDLIAKLQVQFEHVSCERVLCGEGLANLHEVMTGSARLDPADIVERALSDNGPEAAVLNQFCNFLGATAGDLALIYGAWGGVYIGGGIPARFAKFLKASGFRAQFEAKGRFTKILTGIPTRLITRTDIGLLGLAKFRAASD